MGVPASWRRVQRTTGSQDVLYVTTGRKHYQDYRSQKRAGAGQSTIFDQKIKRVMKYEIVFILCTLALISI